MKKSTSIRAGKKYYLFIAGEYVEGLCINSKEQFFQYHCPFAGANNVKIRVAWFMRSQIFDKVN